MKRTFKFSHIFGLLMLSLFLLSQPVAAVTLQEAKSAGIVGEKPNGYAGIVAGASSDVRALVQSVNQKRRNRYTAIARSNGTSLQAVESFAGKKTIQKTPAGQYVFRYGAWLRK